MVAELDGGEFWLPAEFFNDDFNKEGNRSLAVQRGPRSSSPESSTETTEEDRTGELIRRLAHTFLHDGSGFSASTYKVQRFPFMKIPATETRMWPSSPATSPAQREAELDFLYAAAWEFMRMRQVEHKFNGRRIPSLTQQQLQLYQLKRQQLMKQQLASVWNFQSRSAMVSPPLLSQLSRTGMKTLQIDVRGNRRPSAGTGVFLPKREDIPSEALKKPASCTVLPARVSPAAKLNLEDAGFRPHNEVAVKKCYQQQYDRVQIPAISPPPPPAVTNLDVLLPTEWTY